MKILLLLLVFLTWGAFSWELLFSSHTSLAPETWRENLECSLGYDLGSVRACVEFSNAGFAYASIGGELQRGPLGFGGALRFNQTGFDQANLEFSLRPVEYFGISVGIALEPSGFAGGSLSFWHATSSSIGTAGFVGVINLDRTGSPLGQSFHVGCFLPPLRFDSTARFDAQSFSSLELGTGLQMEGMGIRGSFVFDPSGLECIGGELNTSLGSLAASLEGVWFVSREWLWAAALSLSPFVEAQGRLTSGEGTHSWETEIRISWESFALSVGVASTREEPRFHGELKVEWERFSLTLRGEIQLDGPWALEVTFSLSLSLDQNP